MHGTNTRRLADCARLACSTLSPWQMREEPHVLRAKLMDCSCRKTARRATVWLTIDREHQPVVTKYLALTGSSSVIVRTSAESGSTTCGAIDNCAVGRPRAANSAYLLL